MQIHVSQLPAQAFLGPSLEDGVQLWGAKNYISFRGMINALLVLLQQIWRDCIRSLECRGMVDALNLRSDELG